MRVHRNGAIVMKSNPRTQNGPVISIKPGETLREALTEIGADWLDVILTSPTSAILCNSRKHRNYLMTRPDITKQLKP